MLGSRLGLISGNHQLLKMAMKVGSRFGYIPHLRRCIPIGPCLQGHLEIRTTPMVQGAGRVACRAEGIGFRDFPRDPKSPM